MLGIVPVSSGEAPDELLASAAEENKRANAYEALLEQVCEHPMHAYAYACLCLCMPIPTRHCWSRCVSTSLLSNCYLIAI